MDRDELLTLAQRYVWFTPPDEVVDHNLRRLVAAVMEQGTYEDAHALLAHLGESAFIRALTDHPIGALSDKSLAFWHYRLRQPGTPPRARRRGLVA